MAAGTPEVHIVQALRGFESSTVPVGGDTSASIASFTYLPAREGSMSIAVVRDEKNPMPLKQHIDDGVKRVLGKRSATATFAMNLAPTGTAAVTGASSITSALGLLLRICMGGEALAAGSTSSTGSTAIVINVQSGHGSRWAAGKVMGWANSSGVVEWREVESVATDAVTLKHGFSGAPSSTNALYNAATYYMTANPATTLDLLAEGLVSTDRWLLLGGQLDSMTLTIDPDGEIPFITFNWKFAHWLAAGETASSISGTLSAATYSAFNPIVGEAGEFRMYTVGTATLSTASIVYASTVEYSPHITYMPYTAPGPSVKNTVVRWVKQRPQDGVPVSGSWTAPFQDQGWFNARNNLGDYDAQYVRGTAAGSAVILSAPTVQVLNPQRAADTSQLAANLIQWNGRRDEDVASSTTDLAKSPFRIHLG